MSPVILAILFLSSSLGLTRGSTSNHAGFALDSRVKPDYDQAGADMIKPQNNEEAISECIHV